jgi:triphosphatase
VTEFELKFEIPSSSLPRVAAALRDAKATRQRLQAQYYDTSNGDLASHGLVVRMRKEGRQWVQTAKGKTIRPLERLEHNFILTRYNAVGVPKINLARHAGTPVGEAIVKALSFNPSEMLPKLGPIYATDVRRISLLVEYAGSIVEIALDQGRISANSRSLALCELEVELKQGMPEHAVALARRWCAEYDLWLSSITKSMKGRRLHNSLSVGSAVPAVAPKFDRGSGGGQIVGAVLQSCLKQILPNASELAMGSNDPDRVHQLRVGIRRLRTALRELSGLADGIDPAWEIALARVFEELGRHRDCGYLKLILEPQLEAAGGPVVNCDLAGAGIPDPGAVVRSRTFQDVLLCLIGFAQGAELNKSETHNSSRDNVKIMLRLRLKSLRSQTLKDGKKFLSLSEDRQHRVRKRLKRLRYLSEFSAPLFSTRKTADFIDALKPAQDALGLSNNELIALRAYRKLAITDKQAWFGIGWLSSRRCSNAQLCLKEMVVFAKARPFWD